MKRQVWLTTLLGILAVGCGDDVASADTDTDGGSTSTGEDPTTMTTSSTSSGADSTSTTDVDPDTTQGTDPSETDADTEDSDTEDSDSEDTNAGEPADFVITIENISDQGPVPTPFSPGVWVEQDATVQPIYTLNAPASESLELLAEDGDASMLAADIDGIGAGVLQSGVFDTPVDADAPAPIMPGESYEISFTAQPDSRLGLASMMVASNDVIWATGPTGISLFAANGTPIDREITGDLNLFDAGTEANQPPAGGAYQPPPGDAGPAESGVISMRDESTRHIVAARRLLDIDAEYVFNDDETAIEGVLFTFTNISADTGGFVTALSPISWALHDDTVSLITPGGAAADLPGLEALAEDGDGTELSTTLDGVAAVDQNGSEGKGPIAPGDSVSFMLTPEPGSDILSFATMVVMSNDAVIAVEPQGVPMLDVNDDGDVVYRNPDTIAEDLLNLMEVWDIGTEANETPGAGPNTAPNQDFPNTGDADEDATIRYYFDNTNDLADPGSFALVEIINDGDDGAGNFDFLVSVSNVSGGMPFQGAITPVAWGVHDGTFNMFEMGMPASPGLESLAEDGEAGVLDQEMMDAGIALHGVEGMGPAFPGGDFTFAITASADDSFFNFATMVVPSNDTFLALGATGIDLFGGGATPLSDEDLATAIADALGIYDAGTEQNQAAARGRDMAPIQAGPDTGANEGSGNVRIVTPGASGSLANEPVWEYPRLDQMIRVTVSPVR